MFWPLSVEIYREKRLLLKILFHHGFRLCTKKTPFCQRHRGTVGIAEDQILTKSNVDIAEGSKNDLGIAHLHRFLLVRLSSYDDTSRKTSPVLCDNSLRL